MKYKIITLIILFCMIVSCKNSKTDNPKPEINKTFNDQIKKFSNEEIKTFLNIQLFFYDGFIYSEYYTQKENSSEKKMYFENDKKDNLYFDKYIGYETFYDPDNNIISYTFDAGTAYRGYGSYYIIDDDNIIKIEKSIGTTGYGYRIYKNGKVIDQEDKNIN